MKKKLLSHYNKVIAIILSILGFGTACDPRGMAYGTGPAEYGTPSAIFKVSGTITSKDKLGIENIQVIMNYDTAYTDQDGKYEVQNSDFPNDQNYIIQTKDIDGSTNNFYDSKDTVVTFTNPEYKHGDGKWYSGETSKVINIMLDEKE